MSRLRTLLLLVTSLLWIVVDAAAQPLGTFRWQIQPYCNLLTVNVVQQTGVYTLDGTDDRCGAAQAASIVGIAFQNPNGSIGFGLNVVLPGGTPVHIEATIGLPSLNGTWRDSAGNSGTFIFTPGAGTGGAPRPVPAAGIAPGSITAVQLAAGAVGATQLAANSVAGGHVVDGSLTAADLAAGSVTSAQIAFGAVGFGKLAANSVGASSIIDGSITVADIADEPWITSVNAANTVLILNTDTVIAQLSVNVPAAGEVIVNVSGAFNFDSVAVIEDVRCSLTKGSTTLSTPYSAWSREPSAAAYDLVPFGGTRAFTVAAGSNTFRLVCRGSPSLLVIQTVLTALFVAGS